MATATTSASQRRISSSSAASQRTLKATEIATQKLGSNIRLSTAPLNSTTRKNQSVKLPPPGKLQEIKPYTTEEMKLMRQELRSMKAETMNELKLLNDFQQQKAKIDKFWELEKHRRDDLKMQLRNKLRQKQDLEEKQAFELKVYKQKVKHLLHEQQAAMTDVRIQSETALKLLEDEHRGDEHELSLDTRSIKVIRKDMEVSHYDLIKSMKTEQEKSIMLLRQEFERKSEELKNTYEKKMKSVRDEYDEIRKEEVSRIELKKNTHISDLMTKHKRKFEKIKKYYADITHANLELIKNLKEEVGDMKKKEQGIQKEVNDIRRINKKLSKPLQKNKKLVEDLKADLATYKLEKAELSTIKDTLVILEEKIHAREWEEEICEQKLENLKEEKDELYSKLETTIYQVQQKTGFKNLLLEKKMEAMTQDLEKTESALAEVLASTNLLPEVVGDIQHNLEDVLMSKNKQIQKLEDHLQDLKQKYAATISMYENKMAQHQIPLEELGFVPVKRI